MQQFQTILKTNDLFKAIDEKDICSLLDCLSARTKKYKKDDYIFLEGETVTSMGVVLAGSVMIVQEDFWGNRSILSHIDTGGLFAESFSCAEIERLPVSAVASETTKVLFLNYKKIITTCSLDCIFHNRLIENMVHILANKNILLTQKISHITKRTTREKLLSYLSEQSQINQSDIFQLPFNRQQLADFLGVDRSAMSSELGRMRDDGLIQFNRNTFKLLRNYPA